MVEDNRGKIISAAGRAAEDVSQIDYRQAKRELTGESDESRQNAVLDALPAGKIEKGSS